jgi:hypothetical protein
MILLHMVLYGGYEKARLLQSREIIRKLQSERKKNQLGKEVPPI